MFSPFHMEYIHYQGKDISVWSYYHEYVSKVKQFDGHITMNMCQKSMNEVHKITLHNKVQA